MPMELDRPNGEFALRVAELIEIKGHTVAQYEDKNSGACCALGGLRIAVFGTVDIFSNEQPRDQCKRYWDLVGWLAGQVRLEVKMAPFAHGEALIGKWNDTVGTERVIARLREIGGADALAVPQA